ncbi:hypothetical protein ACXZ9C_11120 [Streptococcus agalactiae]
MVWYVGRCSIACCSRHESCWSGIIMIAGCRLVWWWWWLVARPGPPGLVGRSSWLVRWSWCAGGCWWSSGLVRPVVSSLVVVSCSRHESLVVRWCLSLVVGELVSEWLVERSQLVHRNDRRWLV